MATPVEHTLEEIKLHGDRGEFTLYLTKEDIKSLEDQTYAEQFYNQVSKSQEMDIKLQGEKGEFVYKGTPYELKKIKSDICYRRMMRESPRGPLRDHVPTEFHKYISNKTLNAFLASTYDDEHKIHIAKPEATVIVRQFTEKLYTRVQESLNDIGKIVVEKLDAWIICTLVDHDNFDDVICDSLPSQHDEESNETENTDAENEVNADIIWATPRITTAMDRKATICLIEVVGSPSIQRKLHDKKTKKKTVWKEIADILKEKGFSFHKDVDPAEKVSQKFRNLEREYRLFIENSKTTGASKKKKPEFYDELHQLLASKHSINPVSLADTTSNSTATVKSEEANTDVNQNIIVDAVVPKEQKISTPESVQKKKPISKSDKKNIIETIKEMNEQAMHREEKRMEVLINIQKEITKQHDERMKATYALIDVLKK